jgi:hypothetical protein
MQLQLLLEAQSLELGRLVDGEFRLISGEEMLADYSKSSQGVESRHRFCRICGIATHSEARITSTGETFTSIFIPNLEDLAVDELMSAPIHYGWAARRLAEGTRDHPTPLV